MSGNNEIKVFNVEFDGIDKCGKDTLVHTMFKVFPNYCAYQSRGLLSQVAYSRLYNRSWQYPVTEGYIQNTLFVKLDVEKDDWLKRLEESNEIELNKSRTDVDFVSDYTRHNDAFDNAWIEVKNYEPAKKYEDHFVCYNTTTMSAEEIAKSDAETLKSLNNFEN